MGAGRNCLSALDSADGGWRVAGEGAGPGPTLQSRTKGRCVPREESAGGRRGAGWLERRAEPPCARSWAGGRSAGVSRSAPAAEKLLAGPLAGAGEERPTFSGCGRRQTLPTQPGSRFRHTGPPAAPRTQQGTLRWGGREEPCRRGGGGRELGAGLGGRSSAAPRPALPGSAQHLNEAAGCRRTSRQLSGMNSRL